MGKLIICSGKQAEKPYYFKMTNTYVYSVEELCYYIYNNIEVIYEDLFEIPLVNWLQEELGLKSTAEKLLLQIEKKAGFKDYVVCILCSADLYTEPEIKKLLKTMDEYGDLSPIEKKKKKADNYMKYRQFTEAAKEYERILSSSEGAGMNGICYGNLVHNLAVAQIHTIGILAAADRFREAYERNQDRESLKEYISALIICRQDERLKQEIINYGISKEEQEQIQKELQAFYEEAEASEDYQSVKQLQELKDSGKVVPFYDAAGDLMNQWKQKFRRENS